MSKESIRWNIILSLKEWEYHGGNISNMFEEWRIFSIFDSVKATLDSPLLDWVTNWILIKEASIEPYKRWYNVFLDKMLDSIWLKIIKIVDDQWNKLVELNR